MESPSTDAPTIERNPNRNIVDGDHVKIKDVQPAQPVKATARIEDWELARNHQDDFILIGKVFDHPRQHEFHPSFNQTTSKIVLFDPTNNTAETMNTVYTLGSPFNEPSL